MSSPEFSPEPPSLSGDSASGFRPGSGSDSNSGVASFPECGDFAMRIASDGTWFHEGSPIGRKPLVRLFATVLRCDGAGVHWLVTPVERGRVAVEDSAFVGVEAEPEGGAPGYSSRPLSERVICVRTNLDEWVRVGALHRLRLELDAKGAPRPYVGLWRGLEARLLRSAFYHLVGLARPFGEEDRAHAERTSASCPVPGSMGLWSGGEFFPLDRAHGVPAWKGLPLDPRWGDKF